ncbi:DUF6221 family protein [Streptomyces sp. NPDC099050]|uniref:DUF6221 family protein n=1 Tax=Streptomyces sp. NPDC099050 TaxID=3366100 RepID=UPI0038302E77
MPDLHGWISQQIDHAEARARAASAWGSNWYHDDFVHEIRDEGNGNTIAHVYQPEYAAHIVGQDPAAALRRCAADRKLLEIHAYAGGTYEPYACTGCGGDDMGALVDHANDCETLLALAAGYGITADELAALERPEPPRRETSGKSFSKLLAEGFDRFAAEQLEERYLGDITAHKWQGLMPIATSLLQPTPLERALDILGPHLRDQPLYREEPQS